MSAVWRNGRAGQADDLALATSAYGHFTSLQVRDGTVRGLGLHFRRLATATQRLFGSDLDLDRLRGWLGDALDASGARAAASVRILVVSARFERARPEAVQPVDVLIQVTAMPPSPPDGERAPLRLQLRPYERELPEIKHLSTFGLFWQRREARLAGYDDALFVDRRGRISEGSVWNIGFWDGRHVVWPVAAMLDGISQQLLKPALAAHGLPSRDAELRHADLRGLRSAFCCNASGIGTPVAGIDAVPFGIEADFFTRLRAAVASIPAEPV